MTNQTTTLPALLVQVEGKVISTNLDAFKAQAMQDYVAKCGCNSTEEVGNALMKLVSMCGLGMCATVGQPEAVARLEGTAAYIAKTQAGANWNMEQAN